jgi:hypothetical protein
MASSQVRDLGAIVLSKIEQQILLTHKAHIAEKQAMQPPNSPKMNVCATIKCPFFEIKPNSGQCTRYSSAEQCHLNTLNVEEFQSDGCWLFTSHESELKQVKRANNQFLAKDKASQKQLKQLRMKASETKRDAIENKASSALPMGLSTGQQAIQNSAFRMGKLQSDNSVFHLKNLRNEPTL